MSFLGPTLLCLALSATPSPPPVDRELDRLTRGYLTLRQSFTSGEGEKLRWPDLSPEGIKKSQRRLRGFQNAAGRIRLQTLSPDDRIAWRLFDLALRVDKDNLMRRGGLANQPAELLTEVRRVLSQSAEGANRSRLIRELPALLRNAASGLDPDLLNAARIQQAIHIAKQLPSLDLGLTPAEQATLSGAVLSYQNQLAALLKKAPTQKRVSGLAWHRLVQLYSGASLPLESLPADLDRAIALTQQAMYDLIIQLKLEGPFQRELGELRQKMAIHQALNSPAALEPRAKASDRLREAAKAAGFRVFQSEGAPPPPSETLNPSEAARWALNQVPGQAQLKALSQNFRQHPGSAFKSSSAAVAWSQRTAEAALRGPDPFLLWSRFFLLKDRLSLLANARADFGYHVEGQSREAAAKQLQETAFITLAEAERRLDFLSLSPGQLSVDYAALKALDRKLALRKSPETSVVEALETLGRYGAVPADFLPKP